jgi:hypothetical protein
MTLFSLSNKNNVTSKTFKNFIKFDEHVVELGEWGFYVETDEKEDLYKNLYKNGNYSHISIMNKIIEEDESDEDIHPKRTICSAMFDLFCKRHCDILPMIICLLCMICCILK